MPNTASTSKPAAWIPLLFAVSGLLFWAWASATWLTAAGILTIIVFGRMTPLRWNITQQQFHRWGDLSSMLTLAMVAYVYLVESSVKQPIFIVLKWLPLLFCPVLFVQLFSQQQTLPLGTLFYSLRKRGSQANNIDFQIPYATLALLATGAANIQGAVYYVAIITLFGGILLATRPRQSHWAIWGTLLLVAMVAGHFSHKGLKRLHYWVEEQSVEWISSWNADPFKTQTSIGDLGSMKLSDKIELRVKADAPLLLHQASYNVYMGKSWGTSARTFHDDNPVRNEKGEPLRMLQITQAFSSETILALPDGTLSIKGLEGAHLRYSDFGAVKISNAPALGSYQVFFTGNRRGESTANDLNVPEKHKEWLLPFSKQLRLQDAAPIEVMTRIIDHFHEHFYYSLYLGDESDAELALKDFILKRKAGHCEYFAVASVLLLRHAGIPARLATGYMVDEYDREQDLYIVRRRHAHAWALAYIDGVWQAVDATPGQWLQMEADNAGWLQAVNDWFSDTLLAFKLWRIGQAEKDDDNLLMVAALLLSLYLGFRIYSARRQLTRKTSMDGKTVNAGSHQGLDSEFYLIEDYFKDSPKARHHNESIRQWLERTRLSELLPLYRLHYQLRFDPAGISTEQRQHLHEQVGAWLERAGEYQETEDGGRMTEREGA